MLQFEMQLILNQYILYGQEVKPASDPSPLRPSICSQLEISSSWKFQCLEDYYSGVQLLPPTGVKN